MTHNGTEAICAKCGRAFAIKEVVVHIFKYEIHSFNVALLNGSPPGATNFSSGTLAIRIPATIGSPVALYDNMEFYHETCYAGPVRDAKALTMDPLKVMLRDMDPRERQEVYEFMHDALGYRMGW